MTQYARIGAILFIALALWGGAVSAVHAQDTGLEPEVTLNLAKELKTVGPVYAGDEVEWEITLKNTATDTAATDIVVTDILGDFLTLIDAVPSADTNVVTDAGLSWSIPNLDAQESATLKLRTTIAEDAAEGELENCAEITTSNPAQDTDPACASAAIGPTTHVEVNIKPETLNLKSRGVFTVFITLSEDSSLAGITLEDLKSIQCGGATPTKVQMTQKDGGTLMLKYRRQELDKDLVSGGEITCDATSIGGEDVKVTGSDTVRVIGEKKKGLDAFFAGILDTVLPVEDDGEETTGDQATTTTRTTTTPSLNRGQLKKAEQNRDGSCTENCNAAGSKDNQGNGKKSGVDDQNAVTGSSDKGNKGNGNDNAAGNGNGKGNSNKPDTEKGNGKNKK